jgi:hypothetical protein
MTHPMKRYKVSLSIGGMAFVHATHYENDGQWTTFYRGESVIAEYATAWVVNVEEVRSLEDPPTTRGGRRGR